MKPKFDESAKSVTFDRSAIVSVVVISSVVDDDDASSKSLYENKKFIEISSAGVKESHPHEVSIIKEAPNYQGHDK